MAAPSDYYVDPVSGNDTTGDGSALTPWATVQKALNTITRNATDGDRINLADSGSDTLSSGLTLATYGTPTDAAPLIIQGFTSSTGDGGIGTIDGGAGNFSIFASAAYDNILLIDLHLTNTGTATVIDLDNNITMYNCEVDNSTGDGINLDLGGSVLHCYVHNCAGTGIEVATGYVGWCYLANGTNDFDIAIDLTSTVGGSIAMFNIIDIDGTTNGISLIDGCSAMFNSIYSSGGTGKGIYSATTDTTVGAVLNNVVEGFSGAGGIALSFPTERLTARGGNVTFNNETAADVLFAGRSYGGLASSASPFIDASSQDFRLTAEAARVAKPATFKQLGTSVFNNSGALQRIRQLIHNANLSGGLS